MVQRGKVLEIEGPTPKFLYAMLKQLDLKNVSDVFSKTNVDCDGISHTLDRLTGTVWLPSKQYPMAMPLACDSLDFATKWKGKLGLSDRAERETLRRATMSTKAKRETPKPWYSICKYRLILSLGLPWRAAIYFNTQTPSNLRRETRRFPSLTWANYIRGPKEVQPALQITLLPN